MNAENPRELSGRVLVAHPGTQHSYETAVAVEEAGLLGQYVTGVYYKPDNLGVKFGRLLGLEEGQLRRRHHERLADGLVRQSPLGEIAQLTATRVRPLSKYVPQIIRWRNDRFDKMVARLVARAVPAAVVGYDACALHTFRRAARCGVLRVLDQTTAHWGALADATREEAELHPEFADERPFDLPDWWLEERIAEVRLADVVVAGSEYVKGTLMSAGVASSQVVVVPYGVDIGRFRPADKRSERASCRVLYVGRLSQLKGTRYLLEAAKRVKGPQFELRLVGGIACPESALTPYRDHFKHFARVPHTEVHRFYQEADVFVYPSLHEGSAVAIYEALACGLPVITTPNAGSVVRDGIDGFVVPIRDVAALQEKIELLCENPELRQSMSANARARAESFTWAAYRRKFGTMLHGLLDQRAPAMSRA
jgi:starch synthase